MKKLLLCALLLARGLRAQDRPVDPTWLHRHVPELAEAKSDLTSQTCHYQPIFGESDKDNRSLQTVARFGEATLDAHGNCRTVLYGREEEIYFVVEGGGLLHYEDQIQALRKHDFTYLPPGAKHSISNDAGQPLRVVVMGFKIPPSISIGAPLPHPKVANLEDAKEETVSGHPNSVLYKLLAGLRTGKRDLIDEAYVMDSFFWMDFSPGGTNWPHHHEAAEEIYLVSMARAKWLPAAEWMASKAVMPPRRGTHTTFVPTVRSASTTKTNRKPGPIFWRYERASHYTKMKSRQLILEVLQCMF